MTTVLDEMIDLITGSLVGIGQGIGEGITSMIESLFIVTTTGTGGTTTQSLSTFGAVVLIFSGLSLAFGLTRWVLSFFTSLGARNS